MFTELENMEIAELEALIEDAKTELEFRRTQNRQEICKNILALIDKLEEQGGGIIVANHLAGESFSTNLNEIDFVITREGLVLDIGY